MEEEGSTHRPMLYLVKDGCSRLYKGEDVGGGYGEQDARAVERKLCATKVDKEEYNTEYHRTKSAEYKTAAEECFYVLIHFIPILSLTAFICLRET